MSRTSLREAKLATTQHNALQLNVGFLLKQRTGYSRSLDVFERHAAISADVIVGSLTGSVRLTRTSPGIYVTGKFNAEREGECSRCLVNTPLHSAVEISELYEYPPTAGAEFVITEDAVLDLAPLLRELLLLDEPARVLCRPDCAGLCPVCGKDRNYDTCDCEPETIDPRLGVLRTLLDQA
ncbi:MAG: DUF177 domain-containing protein [Anaerolineales bacterium]